MSLAGADPALSPECWDELCLHFTGLLSSCHLVGWEECPVDFPLGFPREKRAQTILYSEAGFYMWVLSHRATPLLPPP